VKSEPGEPEAGGERKPLRDSSAATYALPSLLVRLGPIGRIRFVDENQSRDALGMPSRKEPREPTSIGVPYEHIGPRRQRRARFVGQELQELGRQRIDGARTPRGIAPTETGSVIAEHAGEFRDPWLNFVPTERRPGERGVQDDTRRTRTFDANVEPTARGRNRDQTTRRCISSLVSLLRKPLGGESGSGKAGTTRGEAEHDASEAHDSYSGSCSPT
jgi:hypothetical protein